MATWEKADGKPVTTESRVRVRNTVTGVEGYVGVSWAGKGHLPKFFGPVLSLTAVEPGDGTEPYATVIDAKPAFA